MTKLELLGHDVWALVKNYWVSEERWSAWALLGANLGLTLGAVYISVLMNTANGTLYTALQKLDGAGFYRAFGTLLVLIAFFLAVVVLRVFLNQTLQLRHSDTLPQPARTTD